MSRAPRYRAAHVWIAASTFFSLLLAGCGDQYRPVVTATNPVGPAAQPVKYAVAISSPTSTSAGLLTFVDFSGDEVITTPSIQNQPSYIAVNGSGTTEATLGFTIDQAGTFDSFGTSSPGSLITSDITVTTLSAGAGPVSITPVTVIGTTATVFVPQAGLNSVAALNTSGELVQNVSVTPAANYVVGSNGTPRVYALSPNGTSPGTASALESSGSAQIAVSAAIPVGVDPVYGVMTQDTNRAFVLNQGSQSVSVIDVPTNGLDSGVAAGPPADYPNGTPTGTLAIPTVTDANGNDLSANPIWASLNPLTSELAVLSAGNGVGLSASDYQGTYSATASYALDNVVSYTLSSGATGMYVDTFNGTTPVGSLPTNTTYFSPLGGGAVTIFNIPLCNAAAQPTNPNCNTSNPSDAAGFGTLVTSVPVPVGIAPTEISVMQDPVTPRAYVANTFDSTGTCPAGEGSVSVVNLNSGVVTATICGSADNADNLSQTTLFGHPQTIAATYGDPTGKVYVTAPDSRYLSIIYTSTDSVDTHVPLQGTGVRVVVTGP